MYMPATGVPHFNFNPQQQHPQHQSVAIQECVGKFNGGSYRIDHRDCNSLLTLMLAAGYPILAKPGAMVAMSPSVTIKGSYKISLKKMLTGSEMSVSTFTGPGEVLLAPAALGDIVPIHLDGHVQWTVAKDGFLACTEGVVKEIKSQGLGKAMFSGEGFFLYKFSGHGLLFATSFGAIVQRHLAPGQQYIIDNDHLVAWTCKYAIERLSSGGIIGSMAAGEGFVCRFTGPGTVFFQTRNPKELGAWIASVMPLGGTEVPRHLLKTASTLIL